MSTVQRAASDTLSTSAAFSMTLSGATLFGKGSPVTATGTFDFHALRGATSVAVSQGNPEKRAIYEPASVYSRPAASTTLPAGKSWLVADFSNAEDLGRNFPNFIGQVESLNPGLAVTELALGSTSAVAGSNQKVNGQMATRYDVTVDLHQALARATPAQQDAFALALQSGITQLGGSTSTIAMHVWANDAGLLLVDFTPPAPGIGSITLSLRGYGTAVRDEAPPAAQVVDITAVSPSGERENRNGGDSDGG